MGDTVKFTCISNKCARWIFQKGMIEYGQQTRIANTTYYKLVIRDVRLKHAGTYECIGYDENNHRFRNEGILVVYSKL